MGMRKLPRARWLQVLASAFVLLIVAAAPTMAAAAMGASGLAGISKLPGGGPGYPGRVSPRTGEPEHGPPVQDVASPHFPYSSSVLAQATNVSTPLAAGVSGPVFIPIPNWS